MTERFKGVCECGDHAWAVITRGYITKVSPEDAHLLHQKWRAHSNKTLRLPHYVSRTIPSGPDAMKNIYLHRAVATPAADEVVDHKNGDTLDNRRSNLRRCSRKDNQGNRRAACGVSRFKGVKTHKHGWQVFVAGKYIGSFTSEVDAAVAYDQAAVLYFGEFACTNAGMGLL